MTPKPWSGWVVVNRNGYVVHAQSSRKDLMLNWWHNHVSVATSVASDDNFKSSRIEYKRTIRSGWIRLMRVSEQNTHPTNNQKQFTSEHVFVDGAGRKHFQSDKFPHMPPDWVALSLDNMKDRKVLSERYLNTSTDSQFTRDLKEVLDDKDQPTKPEVSPTVPKKITIKSYRIGALRDDPEMRSLLAHKVVVVWRKWTGKDGKAYKGYYSEFGDLATNDASQMTVFTWNVLWEMILDHKWSDDDLVVPIKWIKVPAPEEVE